MKHFQKYYKNCCWYLNCYYFRCYCYYYQKFNFRNCCYYCYLLLIMITIIIKHLVIIFVFSPINFITMETLLPLIITANTKY